VAFKQKKRLSSRPVNNENSVDRSDLDFKPQNFYDGIIQPVLTPLSLHTEPDLDYITASVFLDILVRSQNVDYVYPLTYETHGIKVQLQAERELWLRSQSEVGEKVTIRDFDLKCYEIVIRNYEKVRQLRNRLGSVAIAHPASNTSAYGNIYEVWSTVKRLHEKKLLKKETKTFLYSPMLGSGISTMFSATTPQSTNTFHPRSLFVKFKLVLSDFEYNTLLNQMVCESDAKWEAIKDMLPLFRGSQLLNIYVVTHIDEPWKLVANSAILMSKSCPLDVYLDKKTNEIYIVDNFNEKSIDKFMSTNIRVGHIYSDELVGLSYMPLFDYVAPSKERDKQRAFKIVQFTYTGTKAFPCLIPTSPLYDDYYKEACSMELWRPHVIDNEGRFLNFTNSECESMFPIGGQFIYKIYESYLRNETDFGWSTSITDLVYDRIYSSIILFSEAGPSADRVEVKRHLLTDFANTNCSIEACPETKTPLIKRAQETFVIDFSSKEKEILKVCEDISEYDFVKGGKVEYNGRWNPSGRWAGMGISNHQWNFVQDRYIGTPLNVWQNVEDSSDWMVLDDSDLAELENMKAGDYSAFYIKEGIHLETILKELDSHNSDIELHIDYFDALYKQGNVDKWTMAADGFSQLNRLHMDRVFIINSETDQLYRRVFYVTDSLFDSCVLSCVEDGADNYKTAAITLGTRSEWALAVYMLSTALGNVSPFNCGYTLPYQSKDSRITKDTFTTLIDKYGADTVRFCMFKHNSTTIRNLKETFVEIIKPIIDMANFLIVNGFTFETTDDFKTYINNTFADKTLLDVVEDDILKAMCLHLNEAASMLTIHSTQSTISNYIFIVKDMLFEYTKEIVSNDAISDETKKITMLSLSMFLIDLCGKLSPITPFIANYATDVLVGGGIDFATKGISNVLRAYLGDKDSVDSVQTQRNFLISLGAIQSIKEYRELYDVPNDYTIERAYFETTGMVNSSTILSSMFIDYVTKNANIGSFTIERDTASLTIKTDNAAMNVFLATVHSAIPVFLDYYHQEGKKYHDFTVSHQFHSLSSRESKGLEVLQWPDVDSTTPVNLLSTSRERGREGNGYRGDGKSVVNLIAISTPPSVALSQQNQKQQGNFKNAQTATSYENYTINSDIVNS